MCPLGPSPFLDLEYVLKKRLKKEKKKEKEDWKGVCHTHSENERYAARHGEIEKKQQMMVVWLGVKLPVRWRVTGAR